MIEFHGWKHPENMDALICIGTWASLITYKSGVSKIMQWRVVASVDGRQFKKAVRQSSESAFNLLCVKLHQSIETARNTITEVNRTRFVITHKKNGRKRAKAIKHISWMHNRELAHIQWNAFTGRPSA